MALSDEKKTKLIKEIIIKRIQSIGDLETLITMLKNLTWTKIKLFINKDLQEHADLLDFNSQESLDEKADILALKEETKIY
jgi:hypothetical protein